MIRTKLGKYALFTALTVLPTFSLMAQDVDKPVIQDISFNSSDVDFDGTAEYKITVKSKSPVTFLSSSLKTPIEGKYRWGGGQGMTFNKIGDDLYEYTGRVSFDKYDTPGEYKLEGVTVENAARVESDPFETKVVNFRNISKPIITPLQSSIKDGGSVSYKVQVRSFCPPNFLNSSFEGPNGNIYGGGSGHSFNRVGDDLYETTITNRVSEFAPSGDYTLNHVSIENACNGVSSVGESVVTKVDNPKEDISKPVIEDISYTLSDDASGDIRVTFTLKANSKSPITFLSSSFEGPNGNIWGGGQGTSFTKLSEGKYEHTFSTTISSYEPRGLYTLSYVSVENAGMNESEKYRDIVINIKDKVKTEAVNNSSRGTVKEVDTNTGTSVKKRSSAVIEQ